MISFGKLMGMAFGSWAGSAMSALKWLAIIGLLTTIGTYSFKFYNHYEDLKTSVANQTETLNKQSERISFLESEKDRLDEELELIKKSEEVTDTVAKETATKQQQTADSLTKITEDRKTKEEILKTTRKVTVKKPVAAGSKEPPESIEIIVEKAQIPKELSNIRINSIWKSYCSSNAPRTQNVDECSVILSTG